jgi:hypothetical protein
MLRIWKLGGRDFELISFGRFWRRARRHLEKTRMSESVAKFAIWSESIKYLSKIKFLVSAIFAKA